MIKMEWLFGTVLPAWYNDDDDDDNWLKIPISSLNNVKKMLTL